MSPVSLIGLDIDTFSIQELPVAESKPALSFSGNYNESVAEFVQAIQKYAFEQDRSSDNRWIAGYAGTCFSDGAALWYSNLNDGARNDWDKLRKALVARYGLAPQYTGSPVSEQAPNLGPVYSPYIAATAGFQHPIYTGAPLGVNPTRETAPNELLGRIEVFVPERNLWLGFLTYAYDTHGPGMGFNIVGCEDSATVISFVPDPDGKPIQIRVHPFMGLAMDEPCPQLPGQPGIWPQAVVPPGTCQPSCSICPPFITGAPTPFYSPYPPMGQASAPPTWTLKPCTESNKEERYRRAAKTNNLWEKASAAIWKYNADTKELGVTWMNDDGSEEDLAVSVPKMPTTTREASLRPQFRRVKDSTGEALNPSHFSPWQNVPVKLLFTPEE
ncbi:hypothetical protein M407DRAFT_19052 [Tulasnella calospora MUT 4182]|uniref:Uncharacterized protein n=1 Tax=Tulasnella calospora MUT 4182 TaxID=1051891 RepID=A0A0C3QSP2_9AGAM|nr:hypothetical protein M407DRAFT_19052 [Tulasnella calospora MUT 4182]